MQFWHKARVCHEEEEAQRALRRAEEEQRALAERRARHAEERDAARAQLADGVFFRRQPGLGSQQVPGLFSGRPSNSLPNVAFSCAHRGAGLAHGITHGG